MALYGTNLEADPRRHDSSARFKEPWRLWYKSPIWKAIKRHRLAQEPNCRCCAQEGRALAATHVDHVEPHLGQWSLFARYENTRSLCRRHHARRSRH